MIATILPSSASFYAVEYNERKVSQGKAELLEMTNFGYIGNIGIYTCEELTKFLTDYTSSNKRIKKPQFHVAISCKGHEYTKEELVAIAHQYMKEMGYGETGQPMLIYSHHDTDNNHIHVITSRVDPHGKKINHHHERLRSQEAINRIMDVDESARLSTSVTEALNYRFSTVPQFMAIMETLGYDCYKANNEVVLKRGGVVQERIPQSVVEARLSTEELDKRRMAQLRAILRKYRDMSSGRKELQDVMKDKFGVSLLFIGPKDKPTGYLIVDHKTKTVFKGSDVCKIKELLQFMSQEERFNKIDAFIDDMLEDNNELTTMELNKLLRRQFHSRILNGCVLFKGSSYTLSGHVLAVLRSNDRRSWLQSFTPSTEQERQVICKMGKYAHPEKIVIEQKDDAKVQKTISQLRELFSETPDEKLMEKIHEDGYMLAIADGHTFCIDFANRNVINMEEYGFDTKRLFAKVRENSVPRTNSMPRMNDHGAGRNVGRLVNQRGGSSDGNREWEVGSKGNYDDIDDEQKLKR